MVVFFSFRATLPSLQTWIQKKRPSVISVLFLSEATHTDDEKRLRSEFLLTVLHIFRCFLGLLKAVELT